VPHKAGTQLSLSPITDYEKSGACQHGSVVRPIHNLDARPMKDGYALGALRTTHSLGHRLSMRWFDSQIRSKRHAYLWKAEFSNKPNGI